MDAHVQFRFNEELISIEDTDNSVEDHDLKRVVTTQSSYLCRKVILACGLLHYIRGGCRHSTHWTPITFIIGRPESVTTAERP